MDLRPDPIGEFDWAGANMDDELWQDVCDLLGTVDAALFGRRTYQDFENYWPAVGKNPSSAKNELDFSRWIRLRGRNRPRHRPSQWLAVGDIRQGAREVTKLSVALGLHITQQRFNAHALNLGKNSEIVGKHGLRVGVIPAP